MLHERARPFRGILRSGAVCVPAETLVAFLEAEAAAGRSIFYIECLYFHADGGTEPSLELSWTLQKDEGMTELIAFARSAAAAAAEGARSRNASAFFELDE